MERIGALLTRPAEASLAETFASTRSATYAEWLCGTSRLSTLTAADTSPSTAGGFQGCRQERVAVEAQARAESFGLAHFIQIAFGAACIKGHMFDPSAGMRYEPTLSSLEPALREGVAIHQ